VERLPGGERSVGMRTRLFCLLTWVGLVYPGLAAEVHIHTIEPTPEHPRNSEGSFVTLVSGRLLFCYTEFYGGASDHSAARLVALHSDDEGRTWSAPRLLLDNEGGANVMSVSLLRLKSGKIALFYLLKNSWLDCRPQVRFSQDEGGTWSAPVLMADAPGYFVLNNDRVIQTAQGRLVAPVAFHRARGTDPETSKSFDARAIALWLLSDDDGVTWREAATWYGLPAPTRSGLQEPGVVELPAGGLLSWFRTDQGVQWESRSTDNGQTWTPPAPGPLHSPTSPASIKRLPGSDSLVALFNDHSGDFEFVKGKRTPLVLALSGDGGKSWQKKRLIESDPDGWYCYTAMHFTSDALLLAYCAGDSKVGGLNRLRLRRVPLAELR
jgi:sialidase-1